MIFSERAVLHLSSGIRFRTDSLRSIGVSDKSQCWGLWTPRLDEFSEASTSGRKSATDGAAAGVGSLGDYHLVISPFHPASWPFLIEIRMALIDRRGTLGEVAKRLRSFDFAEFLPANKRPRRRPLSQGLNILHQDQAPTGFHHLTWTVIAEVIAVRERFEEGKSEHDREFPQPRRDEGHEHARQLACEISREMFLCVHHLRAYLAGPKMRKFLSPRLRNGVSHLNPFPEDKPAGRGKDDKVIKEEYENSVPKAFSVRWMHELPFHAIFGGGSGAPFQMRYRTEVRELELTRSIEYPQQNSLREPVYEGSTAHLAIATFDTNEHYARLVPISERDRRRRTILLEVDYTISARGATVAGLSKGLIAEIGGIMNRNGFSIVSILNKTRDTSLREECGYLRIVAIRGEEIEDKRQVHGEIVSAIDLIADRWQNVVQAKDDDPEEPKAKRGTKSMPRGSMAESQGQNPRPVVSDCSLDVRCSEPAVAKLFISMNFRHPRRKNLVKLIKRVCADCGLEAEIAKTFSDTATDLVRNKIERCDAFLQILFEPPQQQTRRRSWLDFEYGIASGRSLPRMRLVDVSFRPYEGWTEIVDIDRDRYCRPINLSKGDRDLRKKLAKAIREIAAKINGD